MDAKKRRRRQRPSAQSLANIPEVLPPAAAPEPEELNQDIAESMAKSHPIYGAFGHAFNQIGGVDALADWAQEEPGKFYAIFSKMVPRDPAANQINIQINAKLGPGPLDE